MDPLATLRIAALVGWRVLMGLRVLCNGFSKSLIKLSGFEKELSNRIKDCFDEYSCNIGNSERVA